MTHEFDRAEVRRDESGNWLCLHIKNAPKARNECAQMQDGKIYQADIKKQYNKRSKKANAYFWLLCGKLAAAIGIPKTDIYRGYIRDIGDNYRVVPVANEEQQQFIWNLWESQGLGWVVEDGGNDLLYCYYGSSTYDTRQMGRLIDFVVQDCKDQDIETAPPGDIMRWLADWKPEARTV